MLDISKKLIYSIILVIVLITICILVRSWLFGNLPNPVDINTYSPQQSIRIVDRQGRLLYEVLPADNGRYIRVKFSDIPQSLVQATLATEDVNFYHHPGVDIWGILRALWIDVKGGQVIAGGSTITQQLARNVLLDTSERNQKTIRRKLRETYLAWRLSHLYSKNQILTMYLNQTYYGGMAYGVEAAAQTYFGKSVGELDLAQSALIAGLPQAPATYNPFTSPEEAKFRQEIVLILMLKAGFISEEDRRIALNEPLQYNEEPYPVKAPHFVMMVRNEIDRLVTTNENLARSISEEGIIVHTTLNSDWQNIAEGAIRTQIEKLANNREGLDHNVNNAALLAIDPNTGEILALAGSADYFDQVHNGAINMVLVPRQPGSALKPFIYATAMDPSQPDPWTAASMLLDLRTSFVTHDGKAYTPKNYDGLEHGPVLLRDALASSLNIPAVITLEHIGIERFTTTLEQFGITTLESPHDLDLSVALGGGSVSLLELTSAYATFANTGNRLQTHAIENIETTGGKLLYQHPKFPKVRIMDERLAWLISSILSDKDARELGFGKNTILQLDRPAAVKTGTTTNFHDNWTVGYTPGLVVGVWVGNADNQPMRDVTGLTGAAPIWHQFMRQVSVEVPPLDFTRPSGLVEIPVCNLSGKLPTQVCPYKRLEWFIDGTQPQKVDTLFHEVIIDLTNGKEASSTTPLYDRQKKLALDLPIEAEDWASQNGYLLLTDLLKTEIPASNSPSSQPAQIIITSPAQHSLYRLSAKIPLDSQMIKFCVATNLDSSRIQLWLDNQLLTELSSPPYEYWWVLREGEHHLWAQVIQDGRVIFNSPQIFFEVEAAIR
jgi:penicillin-binding protein 1C